MARFTEPLTEKEAEEIAEKYGAYLSAFQRMVEHPTCFMCSTKNPALEEPKDCDRLDVHLRQTHGFSMDEIIRTYIATHA